jgi:two-component system, LytTR family, sensor kinase
MNSEKKMSQVEKLRVALEEEQMKRRCLQTQFDSLKCQINPHFMFNSFNSLLLLIAEDGKKAEQFIHQMSSVYRYVLQKNEQPLISLAEELEFIRSYFYLLKTRFHNALIEKISVSEKYLSWMLPPLTLQLLVENAIKHNVVSTSKPLTVEVFTEDNELIVVNNLQLKTQLTTSAKKGLENMKLKYSNQSRKVIIAVTESVFEVKIPLIEKDAGDMRCFQHNH